MAVVSAVQGHGTEKALGRYLLILALPFVIEVVAALCVPYEWHEWWKPAIFSEEGLFENLTLVFYLATCVLIWLWPGAPPWARASLIYLVLLLVMRELDFDTRWTETSAIRTKFLFSSHYPPVPRLIAGTVLGIGAVCGFSLLLRYWRSYLRGLLAGDGPAVLAAIGFVFLPISQLFDGEGQELRRMLHLSKFSPFLRLLSYQFEETLEMMAPVAFILALLMLRESGRAGHSDRLATGGNG